MNKNKKKCHFFKDSKTILKKMDTSIFFCNFAAKLVCTSTCVRAEIYLEHEKYSIYHQSHLGK